MKAWKLLRARTLTKQRHRRREVCRNAGPPNSRQPPLEKIINLRHPLARLAREIDWGFLAGRFGSVCRVGRDSRRCRRG
jgi:hypothetical protein